MTVSNEYLTAKLDNYNILKWNIKPLNFRSMSVDFVFLMFKCLWSERNFIRNEWTLMNKKADCFRDA